ncbi:MAG: nitrile hydratase accessory protein [Gammaproteobacteria bacterium]|nr:nitrile hydratase accessory protein [Gammaproteobacteria bacterium]NKB62785.1 nitrile hydratase accessory protein [Gammaproteobacteria bacterium]
MTQLTSLPTSANHLLSGQPQRDGEPIFDSPWQAKAFAMALQLHSRGHFEWQEWADLLSTNIRLFEENSLVSSSDDYYSIWLDTLEDIMKKKAL